MRIATLILMGSVVATAQSPLPDAPAPSKNYKPFSWTVGYQERFHDNPGSPHGLDAIFNTAINYRIMQNRVIFTATAGYAPQKQTTVAAGAVAFRLKEWGSAR